MNTCLGPRVIVALLPWMLPCAAAALDANGKWRFEFTDPGAQVLITQATQSGDALSFTFDSVSFAGLLSPGSGGFTNYTVTVTAPPELIAGIIGRFTPSGNLLDGR